MSLAVLVGCGSSRPSRADFLKQANAICKRVDDQLAAVGQVKSAADVRRVGPGVIAAEQRGLAQLRALRPPPALSRDWQRLLGDLGQISANAGQLLAAAGSNDTATAQRVATASAQVQADITSLATSDGLTECAKG